MKRLAPLAALMVMVTSASIATPANAADLTHAELYSPKISNMGCLDAGPADSFCFVLSGQGPEFYDMQILEFNPPYPVEYEKETIDGFRHTIDVRLQPKKIYPAHFEVPIKIRVTYNDGTSEIVVGALPIRPLATLVSGAPIAPATSAKPTRAVTKTVTATAPTRTVTETATVTKSVEVPGGTSTVTVTSTPAAATVTKTQAVTKKVEPAGDASTVTVTSTPAAATVTKTQTVTKAGTPANSTTVTVTEPPVTTTVNAAPDTVKVTETKTVSAAANPENGSSMSAGAVTGIIFALLAVLGAGAFALQNGLPGSGASFLP